MSSSSHIPSKMSRSQLSNQIQLNRLKMERHTRVLEHLLRGDSLESILTMLVELAEETREGMLGAVMLFEAPDLRLQHGASVSLPDQFVKAIDGIMIGPTAGSCGAAAFTRERVIVADVATDHRWNDHRDSVVKAGLAACWSEPIISGEGELLGTFGMYYRDPRHPEPDDLLLVAECANLAALAIERHRDDTRTRQLAAIVDSTDDAIILKDLDGIIQSWNPAAQRIYGYSAEEAIGRSIEMLVPDDRRTELSTYQKYLQNGERIDHFETVRRARDGSLVDVVLTLSPIRDAFDNVTHIVGVQKDITSTKKADQELRETRREHSMLLSNLLGAAFRCRVDNQLTVDVISDAIETITGYSPTEFQTNAVSWMALVDSRDVEGLGNEIHLALKEHRPYQVEYRLSHRNGAVRWIWEQGRGVYDGEGNAIALEGYLTDVTSREAAKLQMRDRERRYQSVIETSNNVILCISPNHTITEWNPGAERVFGYSRDEVLGKNPYDFLVVKESCEVVIAEAERVKVGKSSQASELDCLTRDGDIRTILWNASQLLDGNGESMGYMAVGHDITELKVVQDKLIQSERLAAMGQMISAIAHESRNALQRIQIGVDMLGFDIPEDAEARKDLNRISRAKEDLQHLFEELRGYAAPLILDCSRCSIASVWRQAWTHLESERYGRDITFIDECTGVDSDCEVDAFRLEQVFRNLFENSLAACLDPVCITVQCSEGDIEGDPALIVKVCDNGPGLSKEQRSQLFDAFFTTKQKGTGLGMAIAKRIMLAHFGTIDAGNCESGGACIALSIPRNQL